MARSAAVCGRRITAFFGKNAGCREAQGWNLRLDDVPYQRRIEREVMMGYNVPEACGSVPVHLGHLCLGLVWQALGGLGLDRERALADMNAPEITARMERDLSDAKALRVTATPEYFVNGRPLPSFGDRQLVELVREELQKAYPAE